MQSLNCPCRRRSAKLCRASYQSKLSWFSTLCLGVLTYLQSCALPESVRFGEPIDLFTDTAAILNSFDLNRMPRGHKHISFVFSRAFRDIFSFYYQDRSSWNENEPIKANISFRCYSLAVGGVACTSGLLCSFENLKGISEDWPGLNVAFHMCRIEFKLVRKINFPHQHLGAMPRGYCCLIWESSRLRNCPPTPPLSQHFDLNEK